MKIVIAGGGSVGMHLTKMLSKENHSLTLIEPKENIHEEISNQVDSLLVQGSATSIKQLKEININKTELFIAVTESAEVNITSAILAKKLGAKKTIARINNTEFIAKENEKILDSFDIDEFIYPVKLAADEIIEVLKQTEIKDYFSFSKNRLSLYCLKLNKNAPIINTSLIEASKLTDNFNYRTVAIKRNGDTIIPKGNDKFLIDDLIYVITNQSGTKDLLKYAGAEDFNLKNIMIIGGSRIGIRVAKNLEKTMNVKIVEIDKKKCSVVAERLDNSLIINADGSNIEILEQEGLRNMDAFVAVTGNSETNILTSLLAKKIGVKKIIAEIENTNYINIAETMGIDAIINKKRIAASYIYRHTADAEINSIKLIHGSKAEIMEYVVHKKSKVTRGKIKDIKFPKNAIIGGIIRENKSIIATGEVEIKEMDKVVVFALPEAIKCVDKMFK